MAPREPRLCAHLGKQLPSQGSPERGVWEQSSKGHSLEGNVRMWAQRGYVDPAEVNVTLKVLREEPR